MNISGKFYLIVLFCFILGLVRLSPAAEIPVTPHDLLPEQNIEVVGEDLPQWKMVWDKARKEALQGNFEEALHFYQALLIMKNNLEEARWEMVRLLMHLKRWDGAVESLENLTGSYPENILYTRALGKVMWEMGQYERAVILFKKIYAEKPTDQLALAGLVEGLMKLDRKIDALPYLEQLSRQEPTNRGVRSYLATVYFDEGDYEKARPHLTILARSEEAEPDILYKTAKTYEHLGLNQQASLYWERYVAREPENSAAHLFLAQYYDQTGQLSRSIQHFKALLADNPEDKGLLARLGRTYEKAGDYGNALQYFRKYLTYLPNDESVKQAVTQLAAVTRTKKQPLKQEDQYSSSDRATKYVDLKKNILGLDPAVRYRKAGILYKQLLEIVPGDQEILSAFASDLVVIKENEGLSPMIKYLSDIGSDDLVLYRAIAGLLRQLNEEEVLLAVLQKVNELNPADTAAIFELALLYQRHNKLHQSRIYFAKLSESDCRSNECLQARGALWEKLRLPEHALRDYEMLLKIQPDRYKTRLKATKLAADMGLIDTALFHAGYLQHIPSIREDIDLKILLAEAYKNSGYFRRARQRYGSIIEVLKTEKGAEAEAFRARAWLGIAESYKKLGQYYEAEQSLRIALADEGDRLPFLEALFRLALDRGEKIKAETWLHALEREIDSLPPEIAAQDDLTWKKQIPQVQMLTADGEYNRAIALCRKIQPVIRGPEGGADDYSEIFTDGSPELGLHSQLALNLMYSGNFAEAEKVTLELRQKFPQEAEPLVLLERIYRSAGKKAAAAKITSEIKNFAAEDFGRLLSLAEVHRKYNNYVSYLEVSGTAVELKPYSLAAQSQRVEALIINEEYETALNFLNRLQANYPDNTWLMTRQAELMVKVGNFKDALAVGEAILTDDPGRKEVILRNARILWEMNRWKESVKLYETIIEPSVEDILADSLKERIFTSAPDTEVSWWQTVTFSRDTELNDPEIIMSPQHAVDFSGYAQTVNSIAAPYYALYKWQQGFSRELAVRRSVMRWEYYHAANMLEDLIDEYGRDDFLLFDLAGLYSRLDRLGDEALLYRQLKARNADFPKLAEASQRNNLKRQPQVYLSYTVKEDDGWDGYKAVQQRILNAGGWYYTSVNRKWSLDVARVDYESTNSELDGLASRVLLTYDTKINQAISLALGGGLEYMDSENDITPLYYGQITGKIADELRAVVRVKQDATDDTLASLTRNITRRSYRAGIMLDIIPRIVIGGYHDYIDYSDDNWTKNYSFWASYILLPEPTLFKISYKYDFYNSREGKKPGAPETDGFASDDHPYWSPMDYWVTKFSLYFKHQLSNDALARGIPSYYTIEYSLGYDMYDHDLHELKGSLNIEILKHYTLGASYGYVNLDVYQGHEAFLTLMYRW